MTNTTAVIDYYRFETRLTAPRLMLANSIIELLKMDTMKKIMCCISICNNDIWFVCEYGTKPINYRVTTEKRKLFEKYKKVIRDINARNPLPEELYNTNIRKWATFFINIRFGSSGYCRITFQDCEGDRDTSVRISHDIRRKIKPTHLWNSRSAYLQLAEGCLNSESFVQEQHPHIAKYLFNDLVSREVCEFISPEYYEITRILIPSK